MLKETYAANFIVFLIDYIESNRKVDRLQIAYKKVERLQTQCATCLHKFNCIISIIFSFKVIETIHRWPSEYFGTLSFFICNPRLQIIF